MSNFTFPATEFPPVHETTVETERQAGVFAYGFYRGHRDVTAIQTVRVTLPAGMLKRGFWLYVWRVTIEEGRELLYVGRTGDNSSPYASPPYIRFGQHLGRMKNSNALRQHLINRQADPDSCLTFDFIAHGPIYPEVEMPQGFARSDKTLHAALMKLHLPYRNRVGAMEKKLAADLRAVGYEVMNQVKWKHDVDERTWAPIRAAFAEDFPRLRGLS